jgi:lysophospholipase L1-like esterase
VTILLWLGAIVLVLLVVAAELGSRWWIRHRSHYYVLPPGLRLRLRPDPEVSPELEAVVRFEVNSDGERGDEAPRSSQGLCRILVAGGSQPEGYLLDQDSSWPGALQRLLQRPEHLEQLQADAVHVGNIARSGVGSEGLDRILERVLPRYPRLHTIIVLVGASDVLRWLEIGAPPSSPPPLRTSELFRCHPELTFGWQVKRFALVELLLRWRTRWLRPVQPSDRTCKWLRRARAMRASAKEVRAIVPDPTPMLAHFDRHFRSVLQRAKAHADRVIVVHQPWFDKPCSPRELALMWHGGVGQAWQEEVTTFYSHEVLSALMARLDARTTRIAREQNVEQLDLMPILEPGVKTYYDFFHATPGGARVIAAAVAAVFLRRPMSSASAETGVAGDADGAEQERRVSYLKVS